MADPPHWWVGMANQHLQLMLRGENIGAHTASIDYDGVTLTLARSGDSKNYLFLDLEIAPSAKAGVMLIKFKSQGKTLKFYYELKQRKKGASQGGGFDASDVIYLITPDRFANGNPDNDQVKSMKEVPDRAFHGGRHGGDLRGIIDHLQYIKDMGFTAVWLNPILENDMEKWSYHGYSTTDFYKVDPRYGTLAEYHELCDRAHEMGLKVIADMIENHCGSNHWWMSDLPFRDWVNNDGKYVQTTHRRETIQDPYASASDKKKHSDGWFDKTMPDLNQRNAFMAEYLIQNSIWWVEEVGLDGIRQDTYPYPDKTFMTAWSKAIMTEYPKFKIVGEEWSLNPNIVSYWQKDKVNYDGYVSYLPSVMDFPLQAALSNALQEETGAYSEKFADLYRCLANDYLYPHPKDLVIFADNHDMDRFFTQVHEDLDMWKIGLSYLAITRGIPQFYYGTEILMSNGDDGSHGVIRSDFPGGWAGDRENGFEGMGLTEEQTEAQNFMKNLLTWRKSSKAVHEGDLMHFAPLFAGRRYVLFRFTENEKVMLIINKSDKADHLDLKDYDEVLQGKRVGTNALTKEKTNFEKGIDVPARSALIIQFL
jgi:glycosidase